MRVPPAIPPSVVRRRVSGDTSTANRFAARLVTVRQAPFTATLSPTIRPGSCRGVAIVSRAPLPLGRRSSRRPMVWMMPVNTSLPSRTVEEASQPRVAFPRGQGLDVRVIEPQAVSRRTFGGSRVVVSHGDELGPALRASHATRRVAIGRGRCGLRLTQPLQDLPLALGEEPLLLPLLLPVQLVPQTILLVIRHQVLSWCGGGTSRATARGDVAPRRTRCSAR